MPNHVTNEIFLSGPVSRIKAFLKQAQVEVRGELSEFSFRGFVEPPNHPDYDTGSCGHHHPSPGMADFVKQQFGIEMDPNHPLLKQAQRPEEHPNCWYVWNRENWGTKWDAYGVCIKRDGKTLLDHIVSGEEEPIGECRVLFDTAWSPPVPVIDKIIQLYPDIVRGFRFMDEDKMGHGGGYFKLKDGELLEHKDGINDPDGPDGALWWWLARDLKGYTEEMHKEYLDEVAEDERLDAERSA